MRKILIAIFAVLIMTLAVIVFLIMKNGDKEVIVDVPVTPIEEPTTITNVVIIPQLTVNGSFPQGNDEIAKAWERLYPYYYKFLGRPTTFEEKGVQVYYDENISYRDVETNERDNAVYTGVIGPEYISGPNEDPNNPMYFHLMHELAHIFLQHNDNMIDFDFGQWIWEAHALIAESLTRTELYNENLGIELYDLTSNIGWEGINGVISNEYKYNKEIVDWSAMEALRIMTEVLSYDSDFDYIKRVNEGLVNIASETNDHIISVNEYISILNKNSNGRLIDGVTASDWLFSQPVANINGEVGEYIIVRPTKGAYLLGEGLGFEIAAFNRFKEESGIIREIGLDNVEIIIKLYDQDDSQLYSTVAVTAADGTNILNAHEGLRLAPAAYKVVVEAQIGDKQILGHNFFAVLEADEREFTSDDDRIIIIPVSKGELMTNVTEEINILNDNSKRIVSNYIVITANPGTEIEIIYKENRTIISKPVGGRIIPWDIY